MKKVLGRLIFWMIGWSVDENLPPEAERAVCLAAPHTTNWDFFFVIIGFWVLGVPMKVAIKDDWTKFPFGILVNSLGGLGINRAPKSDPSKGPSQVEQMVSFFDQMDRIALVIAPEGTRRRTTKWKTGFYHIASKAQVPLIFGYVDYARKVAGIHTKALHLSGDIEQDMAVILSFYKTIAGKNPDQFALDERYVEKLS